MPTPALSIVEADDELWRTYDTLARRAYGHQVEDIQRLGAHADRRVAVRDGKVIAGGLGLAIPQFFGGRPVPGASMACGCVAPEERGSHLAAALIAERLRPLRKQGAVVATLWTASSGYVRRLGWEAPTQVFSWTVPADELRHSFRESDFQITHAATWQYRPLCNDLAARWNGPWQRPDWWATWQERQHPEMATYAFSLPGQEPGGVLSVAGERHPSQGQRLVVYDFWAADQAVAAAMLSFLGRHNSRLSTIAFERTSLPPAPLLMHHLRRTGSLTARAWHSWMLRILDLRKAIQLRGWPDEVDLTLPIEVVAEDSRATDRFLLRISGGEGDLEPTTREGQLTLTQGQIAAWYAGGYRSAAAAQLAGVSGAPRALAQLLQATTDREPWLADYF
ncbi:GNAT family N-acetyltransferase [Streptomyces doebereineriae]|uniref:GNAT family N-acetyltransferase n=1 Tax=Streptomyces doebereineriae TaxID=3075528 RepID=A0ABU2VI82_9ACTN|nr:GNAT family N-acetyltransferase [Streptomyces sp. DSM 41640]MDT0485302.1 GNAT family N-acetyltransferase [Streptomyces sp. DSM 41640]